MAEQPAKTPRPHKLPLAFFVVMPVCMAAVVYALQMIYTAENLLPMTIPKDVTKMTLRCLGLASFPMLLFVMVVVNFRVTTRAGNTLIGAESPLMQVQIKTLSNTCEQTLIFALNLLAYSTAKSASAERVLLFTAFFVAGRIAFWVGYNCFYLTNITLCRSPGMIMTLGVNAFLLWANLSGIFS